MGEKTGTIDNCVHKYAHTKTQQTNTEQLLSAKTTDRRPKTGHTTQHKRQIKKTL